MHIISSLLISKHFPESIKSIHSTFCPSDLTAVLYSFTDTFTLAQRSNCRRIKRVSCKQISSTFKEEKTANYEWSPGILRGNTERHLEVALHNFCVSIHNESPVPTGIFMCLRFRICNISCPLCDKCVVPVTGIWQLFLARAVFILQKEKTNLSTYFVLILSPC